MCTVKAISKDGHRIEVTFKHTLDPKKDFENYLFDNFYEGFDYKIIEIIELDKE